MATKKSNEVNLEIVELEQGQVTAYILGSTPMICNRFSKKAQEQLLLPSSKMNRAEKEMNLKHDPVAEFRESVCRNRDVRPAALHVPEGSFKKAIAAAALDMPGATKSQVGRLTSLASTQIDLYGLPKLSMMMVRQSDMNRTPDVRTRAMFPRWACKLTITYIRTLLKERQVISLLAAAGMIVGIGDYRPQKGGEYGQFSIVSPDDPDWNEIVKKEGRVAQLDALKSPVCYDHDTEELLAWYSSEVLRREKYVPSDGEPKTKKSKVRKSNGNGFVDTSDDATESHIG